MECCEYLVEGGTFAFTFSIIIRRRAMVRMRMTSRRICFVVPIVIVVFDSWDGGGIVFQQSIETV